MTIGPGTLVNGKYRLGRQLGEGGMGAIFEARHEFLGTEVALKFLHPALSSRPNVVARFVQEARVSANIRSPHVVSVIDVDQSPEGLAFLVMELLHGESLSTRLGREPILPMPLVVSIALQVLLALEVAHGLGVVHRDMKPENVFLTDAPGAAAATSEGLLVKILDFGIAKLRTLGEVRAQLTKPGVVMGTPEYMAPEQVFAADAVDARADLYALGAMVFEMFAGRRPIQADDARAIAAQVMAGATPRLDDVAPHVPASLADVVAIALAPQPNDRFSSASAMRQALVHAAREAGVPIDAPAAALRTRIAAAPESSVLGGVGLGLAPPAMFGPGDPVAIAAFDARARSERAQDAANGRAPEPSAPSPPVAPSAASENAIAAPAGAGPPNAPALAAAAEAPNAVSPNAVSPYLGPEAAPPAHAQGYAPHPHFHAPSLPITNAGSAPSPQSDQGTLAAAPSPYAPPYGIPLGAPGERGPAFGQTARAEAFPDDGGSRGGTHAGFVSPFATDPSFTPIDPSLATPPGSSAALPSATSYASLSASDRGRGNRYLPWLIGTAALGAIVALVVWIASPSPAPAEIPPEQADTEPVEEPPKRRKPKPEPTPSAEASVEPVPAPKPAPPRPTAKPPPKADAGVEDAPAPAPPADAAPPKPTTTTPPEIIPLPPLPPWPVP